MKNSEVYWKALNYEQNGFYEEAYNTYSSERNKEQNLSKIAMYKFLGRGTEKNYTEVLDILQKIKTKSEKLYLVSSMMFWSDNSKIEKYYEGIEKAANLNNSNALEAMGDMYYNSSIVDKSYQKTLEYYKQAILSDNMSALEKLAKVSVETKFYYLAEEEVIGLLEKNTNKNLASIFYILGLIHSNFNSKFYNLEKTFKYYEKAKGLGMQKVKELMNAIRGV